jgi:hypothetical protein
MVRQYGTTVWYDSMVRQYGTTVWYDSMVRQYGTTVWYDSMVRQYGTTVVRSTEYLLRSGRSATIVILLYCCTVVQLQLFCT